ncbi:hypothetical protein MUN89_01745 [Halobacillus salinarum]|uniref:DUF3188 domain-containing protein n=1 Tax=Halobacillus salinarum TaxID=2932257 RepID=A0ABY4EL08_9BACI|nr:hypothetical protein [Halobacillus salinarum]UOQ44712.1 hypothetical protein MUN89_01745 [Halobacillus salinarum]
MNKQNQMFFILGIIGVCAILASFFSSGKVQNPVIPVVLFTAGILLILGGWADRRERRKKGKRPK